jgi:hypothetical protein
MTITRIKNVWYVKLKIGTFLFTDLQNAVEFAIKNAKLSVL